MWKELIALSAGLVAVLALIWVIATRPEGEAQLHIIVAFIGVLCELLILLLWSAFRTSRALTETRESQRELIGLVGERIARSEELTAILRYHDQVFTPMQIQQVWLDLLNRLRTTYRATNYIESREIYDADWGKAALAIQNGKKRAQPTRVSIQKVFLIDEPEEVGILSAHLEEQRQIGVELQYLYRREIDTDPTLAADLRKLGSVDFGVFDDEHVLVWELDGRTVKRGRILFGRAAVEKHRRFFDTLYMRAKAKHGEEVVLLPLNNTDREAISHWPAYVAPYTELDYALRVPGGWLYTFGAGPRCARYGVYVGGEFVGFSLLDRSVSGEEAEFYVAIHPRKLGSKNGRKATEATLNQGFATLGLQRIYLKVRKDHAVGRELYSKAGYQESGEKTLEVNGKMTEFVLMEVTAAQYRELWRADS